VQCTQQKIQMQQGGVFLVQNLFGMDRNDEEGEKGGVDTDASECVICLTDEKEVAVYPCRHMCMCMSCAEALPSQNNNCPICRRPVTLLLR
jgi:E3 ubiquitin-protein ligase MGRN1